LSQELDATNRMLHAATRAVANSVQATDAGSSLLPPMRELRSVTAAVAVEVVKAAIDEGVATVCPDDVKKAVDDAMWEPVYRRITAVDRV
jgi:malate dehydrogenase (oxaloacetate-decarboxylating)